MRSVSGVLGIMGIITLRHMPRRRGAFVMKAKFWASAAVALLGFVSPASASSLDIYYAFNSVRNLGPSIFAPESTSMVFGAYISPSGSPTTAIATQASKSVPLSFQPSAKSPDQYVGVRPYDASLTGAWSITAANGANIAGPVLTNTIPFVEAIPLVNNLVVATGGLTPTLTWTLPDLAGVVINTELVSVITGNSTLTRFTADEFNICAPLCNNSLLLSSYVIPDGKLLSNTAYTFQVSLGYYSPTYGLIDVSETFTQGFFVPEATPLPAALPLFATGLGALGLLGWRRKRKDAAAIAA
jgi:hypothetical protein